MHPSRPDTSIVTTAGGYWLSRVTGRSQGREEVREGVAHCHSGHGMEVWVSGQVCLGEQVAQETLVPGAQVLLKTCLWQNTTCSVLLVSRLRSKRKYS